MPQSSHRLVVRGRAGGTPMPEVFPSLTRAKAVLRRGSVHMIAGPPASMKSIFTLTAVRKMKVPTLYFSTDSDDFTQNSRALAMSLRVTTTEAERMLVAEPEFCASALEADWDFIRWSFHPSPSLDEFWLEAQAYEEMYGEYPQLTVIDIAMDVDYQDGDEFATLRSLMREMKRFARDTESAVLIVHHTSEGVPGNPCQPRSAIMGKVAQLPILILTTAVIGAKFFAAVVKNRFGKGAADGSLYLTFDVDGDRCEISEPQPEPTGYQSWYDSKWSD